MTQNASYVPKLMAVIYTVIALIKWCAARLATGNEVEVNRLFLGKVIFQRRFIGRRANWV
jgi:flagellar biosynthesis protein FliQ